MAEAKYLPTTDAEKSYLQTPHHKSSNVCQHPRGVSTHRTKHSAKR